MTVIAMTTTPFDYQNGGDWAGERGILIETTRPHAPGIALSIDFPGVWINDAGNVELSEGGRFPAEDMLEWLDAIAATIRERNPVTT